MSVGHILLAAILVAIPLIIKYFLAFEARAMFEALRTLEAEVRQMSAYWQALEKEKLIVRKAVDQVVTQRHHANTRRERVRQIQRIVLRTKQTLS